MRASRGWRASKTVNRVSARAKSPAENAAIAAAKSLPAVGMGAALGSELAEATVARGAGTAAGFGADAGPAALGSEPARSGGSASGVRAAMDGQRSPADSTTGP